MTEEEKIKVISGLGIGRIFEGIGNLVNIVESVITADSISREENQENEKTPVYSYNS